MRQIYESYGKYADETLQRGPNARAMMYREIARTGLAAFEPGAKVVWTTSYDLPMVLYWPFGVVPFNFEYGGLFLAAGGRAAEALAASNNLGYPVDSCSIHRMTMGAEELGFFPHADLLISTTHFCDGKTKCNEVFREKYGVPFHLIDTPLGEDEGALDYVEGQLRKVFDALCELTGRQYDESILKEPVGNYNRVLTLMEEVNTLRKQKPAPYLSGNRGFSMTMVGNMLYGRPELVSVYEQYVKELIAAPREGGPDGGERFRLLWLGGNPTYPNNLFETFREFGARIVAEVLTFDMMYPLSEEKPLRSISEWMLNSRFRRSVRELIDAILKRVAEFQIDAVVSFSHLPCRTANTALYLIKERLNAKGIVFMDLEADLCDVTTFSPDKTRTAIENYIQMMSTSRDPS